MFDRRFQLVLGWVSKNDNLINTQVLSKDHLLISPILINQKMSDNDLVALYLLAYALVILASLLAQIAVKRLHVDKFLPQAGATMILNITISLIIKLAGGFNKSSTSENILEESDHFNAHLLGMSTSMFYYILLPPIIFNSGYHLKRQIFASNFGGILSLAVIGTSISIAILSVGIYLSVKYVTKGGISLTLMECITFASMISSTDPVSTLSIYAERNVESNLFYLVFGESILNDAVALTVFSVSAGFIGERFTSWQLVTYTLSLFKLLIGSSLVGYLLGIGAGYLFKLLRLTSHWNDQILGIGLFLVIIYTPFLVSESISLSGIVGSLAGGIATRRYLNKNVPKQTAIKASFVCTLLSHLAETICFAQLGLCVFMQSFQYFDMGLIGVTIGLTFLARLPVYPILGLVCVFVCTSIVYNSVLTLHFHYLLSYIIILPNLYTQVNCYRQCSSTSHGMSVQVNKTSPVSSTSHMFYSQVQEAAIDISNEEGSDSLSPQETMTPSDHSPAMMIALNDQLQQNNLTEETAKPMIPLKTMHLIYWAGLRGAVSYSCANIFPDLFGNR